MFAKPKINNEIYNDFSTGWWDENSFLNILETGIQPLRSRYIRNCLEKADLKPAVSLDIGCGGGIIAEDLASISKSTTGVDISKASLETARNHAEQSGLTINYLEAYAEELPFDDASFDLFVYDTVNRTLMSYLSVIFIAQDFPITRFAPKNAHVWHKFIRPQELLPLFKDFGLDSRQQIGMEPAVNPLKMLWYICKLKYSKLGFAEFGKKVKFKESKSKAISYLGYCIKQ